MNIHGRDSSYAQTQAHFLFARARQTSAEPQSVSGGAAKKSEKGAPAASFTPSATNGYLAAQKLRECTSFFQMRMPGESLGAYEKAAPLMGGVELYDGSSGEIDLTAEILKKADDENYQLSPENSMKLLGDDKEDFIDALADITGKSPAQIMTALLTMSSAEARELCDALGKLVGEEGGSEHFASMISQFTGHNERLLMESSDNNGEGGGDEDDDDSEKEKKPLTAASIMENEQDISTNLETQKTQHDFLDTPSVNLTV